MLDMESGNAGLARLRELRDRLAKNKDTTTDVEVLNQIIQSIESGEIKAGIFNQSHQTVDSQFNIYVNQDEVVQPDTSKYAYLNYVRRRCENVPLRGLGLTANISNPNLARDQRMRLSKIYVDLETTSVEKVTDHDEWWEELGEWGGTEEPSLAKPISVIDSVVKNRRIILLGGPGSGKTTFIRYLALCIASAQIEGSQEWASALPNWKPEDYSLTPVVIYLRDFDRWLKRRTLTGSANLLWQFMEENLAILGSNSLFKDVQQDIYTGRALLLFDGLDEVDVSKKQIITDSIENLADASDSRIVVTCRIMSYRSQKEKLHNFAQYEIAPLGEAQVDRFIDMWHMELVHSGAVQPNDANELKSRFRQSIWQNRELWSMASNPLLLDSMALVHTHEGFLPQDRVLLYEDCVDLLLWNWEELKIPTGVVEEPQGIRPLLRQAGLQDIDFKRAFWKISYSLFSDNKDEIEIQDIVEAFHQIHPNHDWNWASNIVSAIQERAGLIVEHAQGKFSFPHRTFQEFLAASHLASLQECAKIAAQLAFEDRWREVILLSVGRLVHISGDISKALDLIAEMLLRDDVSNMPNYGLFGTELLSEIGPQRIRDKKLGQNLLEKAVTLLTDWLNNSVLDSKDRKRLGIILSLLGDPRFDSGKLYLPRKFRGENESMLGFVFVSGGGGAMGPQGQEQDISISDYFISRYPITEAQYWQFIQETNRALPLHWINGRPLPQKLNCPVVNVNWYDALAFCRWLSRRIGNLELTKEQRDWWESTDKLILLPTEAEWEKSCRGPNSFTYVWGDEYIPGQTNTNEENLGETVAVGLFPGGSNYFSVMDLGGNVREWTTTRYWDDNKERFIFPYKENDGREDLSRNDNVTRVLKGGAYNLDRFCSMCNYRTKNFPVDRHPYIGFRVVVHQKSYKPQRQF